MAASAEPVILPSEFTQPSSEQDRRSILVVRLRELPEISDPMSRSNRRPVGTVGILVAMSPMSPLMGYAVAFDRAP
jgi:hypothetical protein